MSIELPQLVWPILLVAARAKSEVDSGPTFKAAHSTLGATIHCTQGTLRASWLM